MMSEESEMKHIAEDRSQANSTEPRCAWRSDELWKNFDPFLKEYECPHPAKHQCGDKHYCIFHLPLEEKRRDLTLAEEYAREFKVLFDKGERDFRGFVFPDKISFEGWDFRLRPESGAMGNQEQEGGRPCVNFSKATFGNQVRFSGATFGHNAEFGGATFGDRVDFESASFGDSAGFSSTTFGDNVGFEGATFGDGGWFNDSTFGDYARFDRATFGDGVDFQFSQFGDRSLFVLVSFGDRARFRAARFGIYTNFGGATFGDQTIFHVAQFGNNLWFDEVSFGEGTDFEWVTFGENTVFKRVKFGDDANFSGARFRGHCKFDETVWSGRVRFKHIIGVSLFGILSFAVLDEGERKVKYSETLDPHNYQERFVAPELIFNRTIFGGPALFTDCDLSRTVFQQVDLSLVSFLYSKVSKTEFYGCLWGVSFESPLASLLPFSGLLWPNWVRQNVLFDEIVFSAQRFKENVRLLIPRPKFKVG
ncbi:MAG: pentapeptide repeat-containing protein, partial [Proteobacteria bacterium]|nr:pentapeptide repeat-containing protein [Pseudomonadota bacterium]